MAQKIHLDEEKAQRFREIYPVMTNDDVSREIGIAVWFQSTPATGRKSTEEGILLPCPIIPLKGETFNQSWFPIKSRAYTVHEMRG